MKWLDIINKIKKIFNINKTTTTTTTRDVISPQKKAVCVGINLYPNPKNNLQGCVNDAKEWASLLKEVYGFQSVKIILNSSATLKNVQSALEDLVNGANDGDVLVFTVSSHGTSIPDKNGDESDGRDEAICLYDKLWVDDNIRPIMSKLNPNVTMVFISDSCHSGAVTRNFIKTMSINSKKKNKIRAVPRYMPPSSDKMARNIGNMKIRKRIFRSTESMNEILIAGCKSDEYSYDAQFDKPMGAMSHYAIQALRKSPLVTYNDFYVTLRNALPSQNYPQTPQIEGSSEKTNKIVFT